MAALGQGVHGAKGAGPPQPMPSLLYHPGVPGPWSRVPRPSHRACMCLSPGPPSLGAISGYPIDLRGGQGPSGDKIESRKGRRVARTRGIVSGVGSWGTSRATDSRPGQKEVRRNLMASMLGALYRYPGGTSGAGRADEPWWGMKDLPSQKEKKKMVSVGCTCD